MKLNRNIKKQSRSRAAVMIALIIAAVLIMTGCGASAGSDNAYYYTGDYVKSADSPAAAPAAPSEAADMGGFSDEVYGGDIIVENESPAAPVGIGVKNTNAKLVYTADMYVQTLDFEETVAALTGMVEKAGGYFESTSMENGGYWADSTYKYGHYRVRVPSENYPEFINSIGDCCHVVNIYQNVDDIGQAYYETENRIKTLEIKEQRLHELLEKAEFMSDIIEIENALTETECELEQYNNILNNYDSMVDYSTVNISVEKVTQIQQGVSDKSFGDRLLDNIKNGLVNFTEELGYFIVWLGYNLIPIIIVIIIIVIIILIVTRKRRKNNPKKVSKKAAKKAAKEAAQEAQTAPEAPAPASPESAASASEGTENGEQ